MLKLRPMYAMVSNEPIPCRSTLAFVVAELALFNRYTYAFLFPTAILLALDAALVINSSPSPVFSSGTKRMLYLCRNSILYILFHAPSRMLGKKNSSIAFSGVYVSVINVFTCSMSEVVKQFFDMAISAFCVIIRLNIYSTKSGHR